MKRSIAATGIAILALACAAAAAYAQNASQVVDIPTRPGVTQRFILIEPREPRAAAILFAGGDGGLRIDRNGEMAWGAGNFVVRSAPLLAADGLAVAIVDAPSDHQSYPFLAGFRQTPGHAADIGAVIAWLKAHLRLPVWLIGTSRGTQSAAYVATRPGAEGADGLVLTSTILTDDRSRPVPALPLDTLRIPVLVVHHKGDGCRLCSYDDIPSLMDRLAAVPRHALIAVSGGISEGNPCGARAYHGYNGIEQRVVDRIVSWMLAP